MIDLTQLQPDDVCECGNPECLGAADIVNEVVGDLLASALPTLQSPMLKLIKERNEARELVKRMLRATDGVTDSKEYYAAMLAAHRAEMTWKGGAQ